MPLYEYVCQKCERRIEVIQRVGERHLRICPHCGGKLTKAFSAPAIQFKGAGWYVNDYASAKKKEEKKGRGEKAEGAESKKAESGESKKAEGGESKKKEPKETKEKKAAKD